MPRRDERGRLLVRPAPPHSPPLLGPRRAEAGGGKRACRDAPHILSSQHLLIGQTRIPAGLGGLDGPRCRRRRSPGAVHLSTYYLKFQIVFLKFIVGQERRWSRIDRRLWHCTFQSFRDQVPKCTNSKTRRRQERPPPVVFPRPGRPCPF